MKKMKTIIISSLIVIGFSMGVSAQSSDTKLDQVELTKQFVGTWTTEIGEDTIIIWKVIPLGDSIDVKNAIEKYLMIPVKPLGVVIC